MVEIRSRLKALNNYLCSFSKYRVVKYYKSILPDSFLEKYGESHSRVLYEVFSIVMRKNLAFTVLDLEYDYVFVVNNRIDSKKPYRFVSGTILDIYFNIDIF